MTFHCAFLTTDNLEDFFVYDELVKPHLNALGWSVQDVSWHDSKCDYNAFDCIVVRSTWDYQAEPEQFKQCLSKISRSSCALYNSYDLMIWNLDKRYLKDLSGHGVKILPTVWCERFDLSTIAQSFRELSCEEVVVKPTISANADDTYRIAKSELNDHSEELKETFSSRPFMVQKFEETILTEGETSLFYFNGKLSHAIRKTPADGDFRVQEEHGGHLKLIVATKEMENFGNSVICALEETPLYARIDILNTNKGLALIEVELIEPSLYFNMDEASAQRFAKCIDERFKHDNLSSEAP